MKTRLVTSLILLCASHALAQTSPDAAPAQQVQPEVSPPASPAPAAPPPPPVYVQPRAYVSPRPRLPPPLPPRRYGNAGAPFALGIGGALVWRHEDHARFGTDNPDGGVNVFASYDVLASPRVIVAAGLDYRHDARARTTLAELKDNLLSADLTARVRLASWLWPHLRAGVGLAVTHVGIFDRAASIKFDDRDLGAAGSFGAGFTLRTPKRSFETRAGKLASLSLGVLLEGGYTVAQDAKLTPSPARGADVRRVSSASFTAERSAAYLRILGVIRF